MSGHDEAAERAAGTGDPESPGWLAAWVQVTADPSEETLRWAVGRLGDPRRAVRRFAADVLYAMAFDRRPWAADAVTAIRPQLAVESDPDTLGFLLAAFAEYGGFRPLPEVHAHAGHPDPGLRAWIADLLGFALPDPDAVHVLLRLTTDPDRAVRGVALRTLAFGQIDDERIRAAFHAARGDDDPDIRMQALSGAALLGDDTAMAALWQLANDHPDEEGYRWRADQVERLRRRAPRDAQAGS